MREVRRWGGEEVREQVSMSLHTTIIYVADPVWKLKVIPSHISISLPCLKHCNAEPPLRVGLMRAAQMYQIFCIHKASLNPTLKVP